MLLDVPWPGLVVEMNYRAVPRSDALSTGESAPNPLRYKYDPQIRVMPSVIGLIIFVTLEIAMALFMAFLFVHKSREQADFESGVLRRFFHDDETPVPLNNPGVERLLANFHTFAVQLNRRRGGRSGIVVKDEYDVQDVLHALLKLHFKDVRAEEQTPSHAGAAARMDFLLPDEQTVIEVKMTRDGLRDGKLGEELIVDVERYRGHPGCRRLICFVYDPEQRVVNPFGLAADLARASGDMSVEVIFSPATSQA
ncbi:hypothetical protein H0I86_12120 [Pseudomonas chlororaphis subsp. aurantiaca]|nr:hypothetical protein H0I86_12120 [Pseudomonas chlororaphis subsp. aurantiaca]